MDVDEAGLRRQLEALWPGSVPADALAALGDAADPPLAISGLRRICDAAPQASASVLADPRFAVRLLTLLGSSGLFTRLLLAAPTSWRALFGEELNPVPPLPAEPPGVREIRSADELARALRVWKRRRFLTIAARDLLGIATLDETVASLTAIAEDTLDVAIAVTRAILVQDFGDVVVDDVSVPFVALGMGKLGGRELNFSSDIDLVYLCGRGGTESSGGARGRMPAREFFTRLAEHATRAVHQTTEDGFVFRVDLRLRPEGTNGPIVNTVGNALDYYESWGQTWERAAFLKARPVAGDRALGEDFLRDLEPFIYRRYFDYETLEDIKQMKARVEQALATSRSKGTNVKLGRGGIREIEFIAQSLQLVHAGKDERLRERNTLTALHRLAEHRYLDVGEGERLRESYRFLRDVEHKIQLVDERQTQIIPSGDGETQLARRLGYHRPVPGEAVTRFRAECDRHMDAVHRAFGNLFYSPRAEIARADDDRVTTLLRDLDDEAGTNDTLRALGFRDVAGSTANLRLLRDGAPSSPATPRRKKLLLTVAPALLGEIARAPDPDLALRNMASFIVAIGARSSFLALLAEKPQTLRVLVRLFGSSEFLSQILIRHPEMLDSLVRADLVRVEIPKSMMAAELSSLLAAASGYEERLDALRRFRNEQFLRVGINDLEGLLQFPEVSSQLSDVADVCLDAAWRVAETETLRRFGLTHAPGSFTVVALGKHGSRELTYNSDLDLTFIYRANPVDTDTGVGVHEYFTKLAQTLMTALQVQTREGRVYKIDTRLRPSGTHGPLVSSLDAYTRYHAESSQLWERQALIKARPAIGDPTLMAEVETIIERFVYARPLAEQEVAEIHRLRMRMERELAGDESAGFNIKTGRGGIVDIEFLVQMLQLRHGTALPQVRLRATLHALAALADADVVPRDDAEQLQESFGFLRALTNRLRIEHDQPVEELERAGDGLAPLARRLGYEGSNEDVARELLADYKRHRDRVRAIYNRWFRVAG